MNSEQSNRKLLLIGIILMVLILGSAVIYWQLSDPSQETVPIQPLAEVPRADLTLVDGSLFQAGATNPFTGFMIEFYASESLKSRSMVSNGLLQGVSEGWHTNGQISVREHFQNGVSHGPRTKWYITGSKLSEASIVDGQLQGPFRRWHENGVLSEEMEMEQGKADGLSRAYFPSGFLKAEVILQDGKPVEQQFWKDGEFKLPTAPSE